MLNITTACLLLCICLLHRYLRKEWVADIKNEHSNLPKIIRTFSIFHRLFEAWVGVVHQAQIWVALKKVWELRH